MSSEIISFELPEARCPHCNEKLNGAAPTSGEDLPESGDVSICAYCTTFLIFNDELVPQELSDEQFRLLPLEVSEELLRVRAAISGYLKKFAH